MKHSTPQKPLAKSAIAIAVLAFGALGVYAGSAMDDGVPQQAAAPAGMTVPAGATAWGASPLQLTQAGKVPAGAQAANLTEARSAGPLHVETETAPRMNPEAMARLEMPADFIPNNAEGSTENAPFARIHLQEFSSGAKAIQLLGNELEAVAQWYGMSGDGFRQLLLTDSSVHLDTKGRVLHVDAGVSPGHEDGGTMAATTVSTATTTTVASPFPLDQTFKLHTKASSTRVLYLNFSGQGQNPAFDLDKNPATFNDAERLLVQKAWLRVAEDYAAFDVDVTTEAPAVPQGKIGATVLITPQTSTAGGYAYLNSFTSFAAGAATAYCFPNNLANSEKPIAECISHELGHTLGLTHQGATPSTEYYGGQGSGETGWAPIMGVSYYKNLTQWAKGEYANANNKQDAYLMMSKQGLKARADDHGNSIPFADALNSKAANGLNNLSGSGVIETPGDADMFSFVAGAGSVSFKISGAALGGNLDVSLQLLDVNGKLLASANPGDTLAATISATLPAAGKYFLSVSGAGKGDPLKTGYSNYGSLGQYSISGTSALGNGVSTVAAISTSSTGGKGPLTIAFDAGASVATGSKIVAYQWNFGDGSAAAAGVAVKHTYTKAGSYEAVLKIVDFQGSSTYKGVKITIS